MEATATTVVKTIHLASPTPRPAACGPCPPPIVDCPTGSAAQGTTNGGPTTASGDDSHILVICLRSIAVFIWAASRSALQRMLIAYLQSNVPITWRSFLATTATAAVAAGTPLAWLVPPAVGHADGHHTPMKASGSQSTGTVAHRAVGSPNAKKVSWSYLRGVSLALSELCQEDRFGGGRIPLSAILDLMRQHQSAFVPLGPHVEKDVPKRLVQLANEDVVFFDPFEEYVVVPEVTRQKYVLRRQQLLAEGVDPADLSVFGAALTRGLSANKRVTNAAVASYKAQFLLRQQQQQPHVKTSKTRGMLTREESLMSMADAIRPPSSRPDSTVAELAATDNHATTTRRGHSIVMDMAKIIGCHREGAERSVGASCGLERSVLPEMSAIVYQRDTLEVENDRLRTFFGLVD